MRPLSLDELKIIVSEWFQDNDTKIRIALKGDARLREFVFSKKSRDQRAIAALVLDALTHSITGAPLATAALIITHYYLDHYIGLGSEASDQPRTERDK